MASWSRGRPFKQDIVMPANYQTPMVHANNNVNKNFEIADPLGTGSTKDNSQDTKTNSFHPEEKSTELSSPCPVAMLFKKKAKQEFSTGNNSWPLKKMKEGIGAEVPSDTINESNKTHVETPNKEIVWDFTSPNSSRNTRGTVSNLLAAGEQPPANSDGLTWGKKAQSKRKNFSEQGNNTAGSMKKRGRSAGLQVKSPQHSAEINGGNATCKNEAEIGETGSVTKQIFPVVLCLECTGARASRTKQLLLPSSEESLKLVGDQQQCATDPSASDVKEGGQSDVKDSTPKRGRGRPRKIPVKSAEVPVADKECSGDVAVEESIKKNGMNNEVDASSVSGALDDGVPDNEYKKLIGKDKKLSSGPSKQKDKLDSKSRGCQKDLVHGSSNQQEKHSSKRTKRRTMSLNLRSCVRGSEDATSVKTPEPFVTDSNLEEMERAVDKLPSNVSDDQPLSRWFEGMHSLSTADASRVSPSRTVQQITEASEIQGETALQTSAVVDAAGETLPVDNQILPFVKSTPLWVAMESMEVFKIMPQKPHFRPLSSCKESLREGLAIGSMVNFATVVEKTSKLHFEESRSTIKDSLDILCELESHGFDVKVVQDRLTKLLCIKDKQGSLEDQLQELKNQIVQHNVVKTKLDGEIDEIDKQIRELQEKCALTISMKGIKDSEVASLQSRLEGINEETQHDRLQFESLVAVPW